MPAVVAHVAAGTPPPDERPYQPRGAALKLLSDRSPEIILDGPAGTGKSRGCLEKIWICANKYAESRHLITRKTRASLTEAALVTFEQYVVPANHPCTLNQVRRVRQSYELDNGSVIVVGGLDKPDKVMSTEWDTIYVQEARECTEVDWESLNSRLRNGKMPYQQIIGDTNPDAPMHWIKQRERSGKLVLHHSRHQDNPLLWSERLQDWTERGRAYMERLNALTGVRLKRLRDGLWVSSENVIYDMWDPNIHHVQRFPLQRHWRRFIAVDFGFTHPFSAGWWAVDDDGRLILYRELHGTHREVRDWGHLLALHSRRERIAAVVTDHDSEDRRDLETHMTHTADECDDYVRSRQRSPGDDIQRITCGTTPAYKSVTQGINAVKARLRVARDGLPRLQIMRDSLVERDPLLVQNSKPCGFAEEVENYRWSKATSLQYGEVLLEEPVKIEDDACDMVRYAVMHVDDPRTGYASAMGKQSRVGVG